MTTFLRNSCGQNSHEQIFNRKAGQPSSSVLATARAHSIALLSQTVVSCLCLRYLETLNIPKYNLKTFTHIISSFAWNFSWTISAKLFPNTKLRTTDCFWQRRHTLQLFFHCSERVWLSKRAMGKVWGESLQRAFLPPHKPGDYRLGGVEKEQRGRDSETTAYTQSADILAAKFHNALGALRLELSRITQTISTTNFFRLTAELWARGRERVPVPQFCKEPWSNLER